MRFFKLTTPWPFFGNPRGSMFTIRGFAHPFSPFFPPPTVVPPPFAQGQTETPGLRLGAAFPSPSLPLRTSLVQNSLTSVHGGP